MERELIRYRRKQAMSVGRDLDQTEEGDVCKSEGVGGVNRNRV